MVTWPGDSHVGCRERPSRGQCTHSLSGWPQNLVTHTRCAHVLPGVGSILNTSDSAHIRAVAMDILMIFQICGLGAVSFMEPDTWVKSISMG